MRAGVAIAALVTVASVSLVAIAQAPASGTIAGVIVGAASSDATTQTPLTGAVLTLSDAVGSRANQSAIADGDGRFAFAGVPAGRYALSATKPGYLPATFGARLPGRVGVHIALADGQLLGDLRFVLTRGAVVAGTVWAPDGQPAAGASIRAVRSMVVAGGRRTIATVASGITDDRGQFRLFNLPPGDVVLAAVPTARGRSGPAATRVIAPSYWPGVDRFESAPRIALAAGDERTGMDIRLTPVTTASLTGVVRGLGASKSARTVRIFLVSGDRADGPTLRTADMRVMGSEGSFAFDQVPVGLYRIVASSFLETAPAPESYLWGAATLAVTSEDAVSVDLLLQPAATVTATLEFSRLTGRPRPNLDSLRLVLHPTAPDLPAGGWAGRVSGVGHSAIPGVPPGRYQIEVLELSPARTLVGWVIRSIRRDEIDMADRTIGIGVAEMTRITITLADDTATLTGTLPERDWPAGSAPFIVLVPIGSGGADFRVAHCTRPATDRSIYLRGLEAGEYAVALLEDFDSSDLHNPDVLTRIASETTRRLTFQPGQDTRWPVGYDRRPWRYPSAFGRHDWPLDF